MKIAILCAIALCVGAIFGRSCRTIQEPEVITRIVIDTVEKINIKHDTVFKEKVVTRYLKLIEKINDTLRLTDSVRVEVPIYKYVYNKDSSYYLEITGYEVNLEKLIFYQPTKYKTIKVKQKPKWGIGIQGGYGFNGDKLKPYVGVGVQYNILTF